MKKRFGAVIAAAGMSGRMNAFMKLSKTGDMTMAERVVMNFRQAGIDDIVVVTGFRAEEVEKSLKGSGVVFLRNTDYEKTEMIDSAVIGLNYLKDRCNSIFFCPVGAPFFSPDTVKKEMKEIKNADVIVPYCDNRRGHPLLLSHKAVEYVFSYNGGQGMKGAYESLAASGKGLVMQILVDDIGAVMRADTEEDYNRLIEYHNDMLLRPEIKVNLSNHKAFFDHDTMLLLRQVDLLQSVREACKKCGISYSKGRNMIALCEKELGYPVIDSYQGGKDGGISILTFQGKELIERFETFERVMSEEGRKRYNEIFMNGKWLKGCD